MKVKTARERAAKSQAMVLELLAADQPPRADSHDPNSKFWAWIDQMGVAPVSRYPKGDRPTSRYDSCRDLGQPRFLHQLRPLRARVPRSAAERRHRHGLPRCGSKVMFDFDKGMGDMHLRRLRRVRAGLPDRRADGVGAARQGDPEARRLRDEERRHALPLLRCRLPDQGACQGRQDPLRRRPRWTRQQQSSVRQRPLRLRLHPPRRPSDEAAYPSRRHRQGRQYATQGPAIGRRCSARRRGTKRSTARHQV